MPFNVCPKLFIISIFDEENFGHTFILLNRTACERAMFCVLVPSAAELIALFLYQADVASSIAREIVGKENVSVNGTQADSSTQCDGSL